MNKKLQQQHTSYATILFINFTIYFDRFFSLFENKKKKKKHWTMKISSSRTTRANISSWTAFHLTRWHRKIITLHWSFCFSFGSVSRCMQHWARPSRRVLTRQPWTNLSCPGQTLSFHRYPPVTRAKPGERSAPRPYPFVINLWNNAGKVQKWTNETSRKPSFSISYSLVVHSCLN